MPTESLLWEHLVESTLHAALQSAGEGLIVFDADGLCRMAGRKAGEFFGTDPAGLVGLSRSEVVKILGKACEDPTSFVQILGVDDLNEPPQVLGEIEVRIPRRVLLCASFPIRRETQPIGRILILRDVSREVSAERARRHLLQRVEQLTPLDALTGLVNRRRFTEDHEREHARAGRAWDTYALLRLDIDGIGHINEVFGVPVGDTALERAAEILGAGRRDYDVIARLENDDFALLLPGADGIAARAVADRIKAAFDRDRGERSSGPQVSVGIGVAVCVPPTGESAKDVLRRASEALATARTLGTSQIHVDETAAQVQPEPHL